MTAKLPGVGPLSPPQPVNPRTQILDKRTVEKFGGLSFLAGARTMRRSDIPSGALISGIYLGRIADGAITRDPGLGGLCGLLFDYGGERMLLN